MSFFFNRYEQEPKKEIDVNAPPKQGLALFFSVLRNEFWELIKLNLVFIIFCLPAVTIPAAITAMSKITIKMLMDQPVYVFSEFLSSFKAEWKRATIVGAIYFPLLAATLYGQYIYLNIMENFILYAASIFLSIILITAGFYIFPMIAVLDTDLKGVLKNAVLLVFIRAPHNVLALIAAAALALFVLVFFPLSSLLVILILFSLTNLITTFCAYTGIKKFVISP